jgi:hypothetical protein
VGVGEEVSFPELRCQRIELLRSGQTAPLAAPHLLFADHVHDFDTTKEDAGTTERLEPEHRPDDALDGPVILLDDIVEVLALPNRDRRVVPGVIAFDPRRVGAALVDRDGLRKTIALNGPSEKPLCGSPIALGGEQEVDGVALFVHQRRAGHTGDPTLPGPPQHPAHHPLYRTRVGSVQGLLARLTLREGLDGNFGG